MSRHRNIRTLDYSEEYDYDEVFGHSVEEDCILSPSEQAFIYDRSRRNQPPAYFHDQETVKEEEEEESESAPAESAVKNLSDLETAKLQSCLDEIRSIIGDIESDETISQIVINNGFDVHKTLDVILKRNDNAPTTLEPLKRQEVPRVKTPITVSSNAAPSDESIPAEATVPTITVATPSKASNIIKGFSVPNQSGGSKLNLKDGFHSPRPQSPASGRSSPFDGKSQEEKSVPKFEKLARNFNVKEKWMEDRGDSKENLHMVVVGHVDAGKSTLVGHLMVKMGLVSSKVLHKYEQESKKLGKQSFIYAWIMDETGEERNRGITMDIGFTQLETKTKTITILDAPGHKDFIPNMITGATQADVALLVVDATKGEFETGFESGGQTREHALLIRSLGVTQLGVVINKLDTVNWSEDRFNEIVALLKNFLKQAGFKDSDVCYVPCSGMSGENLTTRSNDPQFAWYQGPTLLDVLENFKCPERSIEKPFRMTVNDIYKGTGSGFCVSGQIETGALLVNDKVLVQPQNELASVKGLTIDELPIQTVYAGDSVSITLANFDIQNISIGSVLSDPSQPVAVTSKFECRIVVFNIQVPITKGFPVIVHCHNVMEPATIKRINAELNRSSGAVVKKKPRCLVKNTSALVVIETSRPICLEKYQDIKQLGRIMLRVSGSTIAAGLVTQIF
nr:PREDICTED: HBS1-like protein [Bemisia tabaci]